MVNLGVQWNVGTVFHEGLCRIELRLKHHVTLCYHTNRQMPVYKSDWAYETTGQFDAVVKLEPF